MGLAIVLDRDFLWRRQGLLLSSRLARETSTMACHSSNVRIQILLHKSDRRNAGRDSHRGLFSCAGPQLHIVYVSASLAGCALFDKMVMYKFLYDRKKMLFDTQSEYPTYLYGTVSGRWIGGTSRPHCMSRVLLRFTL